MTPRRAALVLSLVCLFFVGPARSALAQESQDNQPHVQPRNNPPPPSPKYTPPPFPEPDQSAQPQAESSSKDAEADFSGASRAKPAAPAGGDADDKTFRPYDPHRADKDLEVGNYYLKLKNYRAALERFNDALLYKPNDAEATFGLAVTQEKLDLPDKARQNYSKYLEILPHGPRSKECQEALKRIESRMESGSATDDAARQSARDIEAGETFLTKNNYDAAYSRFADALRLTPDNPQACFRLAQSLQGLQRLDEARLFYKKYLELAPHGPFVGDAKRAIADINFIMGK